MANIENLIPYQFRRQDYIHTRESYMTGGHWDREKLLKDARKVAKSTNQRLLRLEQQHMEKAPAYRGAVKALEGVYSKTPVSWGRVDKRGRPRFKERVNSLSNDELLSLLYMASRTQQARTSTPAAVKNVYSIGMENLKGMVGEPYSESLTYNDVLRVFQSAAYEQAIKLYGYKAVLQIVDGMTALGEYDIASKVGDAVSRSDNLMDVRKALGLTGTAMPSEKGWIEAP